jgi:hypothetical protein
MAVVTLTDKRVAAVRPPKAGRSELWDKLEPGLALRVTEKDARTWTLKIGSAPQTPENSDASTLVIPDL